MSQRNVLVIMMDEISREGVGCYGGAVLTPNMDKIASQGTVFTNAYTPSPICVPARAAFQSGQYVFQNRCWSNAQPYDGRQGGWAHELRNAEYETLSVGKLHYRSGEDDSGYYQEIVPLYVKDGIGWIHGLLRRQNHTCFDASGLAAGAHAGNDMYSDYDISVRDESVAWLKKNAAAGRDKPWAMFVSFLRPHYPLTCPQQFLDLYDPAKLPPIRFDGRETEYRHPVINASRSYNNYDDYFEDDAHRDLGRACYFGLCSFVDDLIGDVLRALEENGADKDTIVVVTSDHGDLNGHHGMWTKMTMHEESAGIPLILAGAGAPAGRRRTAASLIDVHPTALAAAGLEHSDQTRPGRSLLELAAEADDPNRPAFSEYHDGGSITGFLMIRQGPWKYIAYPGFAPQLFNVDDDPHERNDLGLSAEHAPIRQALHNSMCETFGDPDQISDQAFADQAKRIEELGGVDAILKRDNYDFTPVE